MLAAASQALLRSLLSIDFRNSTIAPTVQCQPFKNAGYHTAPLDIITGYKIGLFHAQEQEYTAMPHLMTEHLLHNESSWLASKESLVQESSRWWGARSCCRALRGVAKP